MFSGFIIILAWLISAYDRSMTFEQRAYQNIINIITIGDQVTDYLFIINLYFQLEHLHTQKIHGNPTASSKYHDTLIFIILVSSSKCVVFFVNFFCALTFGELKSFVSNILEEDFIILFLFLIPILALFLSAMSNSELNSILYGKKENKFVMTLIGLLVDDIPQLILQLAYAIVEDRKYYQKLSPIQIASFTFMLLRLTCVIYKKYKDEKRRLEGREEGRDYHGVAMDGLGVAAEIFSA